MAQFRVIKLSVLTSGMHLIQTGVVRLPAICGESIHSLARKITNKADLGRIIYDGPVGVNVRTSPDPLSAKVFTYKQKDPGLNAAFGYP